MNKAIETYISRAMPILENAEIKQMEEKNSKLSKEYKGYLSSLGASMRMSGLVPTLAFFSSKENSAKADRRQVLDWITTILNQQPPYSAIQNGKALFDYSREAGIDKNRLEKDILDASVALKLCIRTFELTK
jgi:CRISPR type III-B/RAMP module-associated protein Cmr5